MGNWNYYCFGFNCLDEHHVGFCYQKEIEKMEFKETKYDCVAVFTETFVIGQLGGIVESFSEFYWFAIASAIGFSFTIP